MQIKNWWIALAGFVLFLIPFLFITVGDYLEQCYFRHCIEGSLSLLLVAAHGIITGLLFISVILLIKKNKIGAFLVVIFGLFEIFFSIGQIILRPTLVLLFLSPSFFITLLSGVLFFTSGIRYFWKKE